MYINKYVPLHVLLRTVASMLASDVKLFTKNTKKESGSLEIALSSAVSISSPIPKTYKTYKKFNTIICCYQTCNTLSHRIGGNQKR